jgi:hypothetical protein
VNPGESLEAGWLSYLDGMARLKAIHAWIDRGRPEFYAAEQGGERARAAGEINKVLRPLLDRYTGLSKKDAIESFKLEREEIRRIALVRLFSGFEADFQREFARWLKAAFDTVDEEYATKRSEADIHRVLPNSLELCLLLFQQLQPRLSGSEKGWLDGLRGWRNEVMHGGFLRPVEHDVEDVYQRLGSILRLFERPASGLG